MKWNKSLLLSAVLLVFAAALYRVWPGRNYGFAPQVAMALFAGAVIKDKKLAFLFPLLSMFLSDVLYYTLAAKGVTEMKGFYEGQILNYLCIAAVTAFGFLMKKITALRVAAFSLSGSAIYFLLSNFTVWAGGGGFVRPKTFDGLMMCYYDGLAFYRDYGLVKGFYGNVFLGDLFFCALLFGSFAVLQRTVLERERQLA
jgi:hypothetical protein